MKNAKKAGRRKKSPLPHGVATRIARKHDVSSWHVSEVARGNRVGSEAIRLDIDREIRHAAETAA